MLLKAVFCDLDGTTIDSEPLWHDGEIELATQHGGYWDEDLGWECSGKPVPEVAEHMIEHGCTLSIEEIDVQLKAYVFNAEQERLPWIDGVRETLQSLRDAGIPVMLVTTSPRPMAENIMEQAGGLFLDYVCGDDDCAHKPDPAPYLLAAKNLGIAPEDMGRIGWFRPSTARTVAPAMPAVEAKRHIPRKSRRFAGEYSYAWRFIGVLAGVLAGMCRFGQVAILARNRGTVC